MNIRELIFLIKSDLYRINGVINQKSIFKSLLLDRGFKICLLYRICNYLYVNNNEFLLQFFKIINRYYQTRYCIDFSYKTQIGSGLYLGHVFSIVVSLQAKIGKNVNLSQGVTIGYVPRGQRKGYPTIGNNVYVGPGAKVIGNVTIGNNVAIGANCVITNNIPDNAVVVGIPGKVISYKGSKDYVIKTDYEFFKPKINVLHLISSLEVGGAEKLLIDLIKNNHKTDLDLTVVIMNNKIDKNLKQDLMSTNCNVYFLDKQQGQKNPKHFFSLLSIIKKHKIHIIHSHNYGSKMWSILCKFLNPRLKLVYTAHDTNIIPDLSKFKIFLHKKFINTNIAVSKAVLADCCDFGLKTVQIYNGINLSDFSNKARLSNKSNKNLTIINVSRINNRKKGQDILIKALKDCKDKGVRFTCSFVGGVYDYDKDSITHLQNLVKELDLEEEVSFLGNRYDIPELLSKSGLFILPSRYEGLGLVILEAMASGVPVIASNIDGPAELIRHGENGLLFESEDHIDLADKIIEFYNNPEKMSYLAQNAYEFVQQFDISVMVQNYYLLYGELLSK